MRIGILTSPLGGSPLIHALPWEPYRKGDDVVLVCNQTAHTREYVYPELPEGVPVAFLDTAEYGTSGQPWNAFDGPTHDTKNAEQQARLRTYLDGRSFPYFLREMWKDREYPAAYHPIDYPLPSASVCDRKPNRDEYLSRQVDVACIWGQSNAGRVPLTSELRALPVRKDIYVVDGDGPRLPQPEYFRRLEAARCTINFDGYGSSSFRLMEGMVRTATLVGPLRIRMRAPFLDGFTFDGDLGARIMDVLADPERAFEAYRAGYEWCNEHYSQAAVAKYIVETIEKHDWSTPTWI